VPTIFTYEARILEVLSISPAEGPLAGGTEVAIFGRGFEGLATGTATVEFDGVSATSIVVENDQRITCITPAHATGTVDVVVTNSDGDTDTFEGGFSCFLRAS
jgi:uncharacterized protein (TIGR03437 family)